MSLKLFEPKSSSSIKQRFNEDVACVTQMTEGAVSLQDIVQYVFNNIHIGIPAWNCDGTCGINNIPSFFGVAPSMVPGCCTDLESLTHALTSAVKVAGGSTRVMLHMGLHLPASRLDAFSYEDFSPWQEWERSMRSEGCNTCVSFDPTLWGGPLSDKDTRILGSPFSERRNFFIGHMQSGLTCMVEFYKKRLSYWKNAPAVGSNVWISGSTKRPWANQARVLELMREAQEQIFGNVKWQGCVNPSQEGKAPPTQQTTYMEVDNYCALALAKHLGHRWLLDIGHRYPSELLSSQLAVARAFAIPLAAHVTLDVSGADDDLTLGLMQGPARDFIRAATRLDISTDIPATKDASSLYATRRGIFGGIDWGVDTFEAGQRGWPPELALVQGAMVFRELAIAALIEPIMPSIRAEQSGIRCEYALSAMAEDLPQKVDLANCVSWWRTENGQDPNWVKQAVQAFEDRCGEGG